MVQFPFEQDNVKFINEVMTSWVAQGIFAALVLGLVIVAFARASRTFDNDRTRRVFRVAVAALGVLIVMQAVTTVARGHFPVSPVLLVIEYVWLVALWLYYFIRFMTHQRSGSGDPETQRRGAVLDGAISRLEQERCDGGAGRAADGAAAPR